MSNSKSSLTTRLLYVVGVGASPKSVNNSIGPTIAFGGQNQKLHCKVCLVLITVMLKVEANQEQHKFTKHKFWRDAITRRETQYFLSQSNSLKTIKVMKYNNIMYCTKRMVIGSNGLFFSMRRTGRSLPILSHKTTTTQPTRYIFSWFWKPSNPDTKKKQFQPSEEEETKKLINRALADMQVKSLDIFSENFQWHVFTGTVQWQQIEYVLP
jgi:hypothetical protein